MMPLETWDVGDVVPWWPLGLERVDGALRTLSLPPSESIPIGSHTPIVSELGILEGDVGAADFKMLMF